MKPTLYHYTCDHSHAQIDGELLSALAQHPHEDRFMLSGPHQLVWMTDLAHPNRDALGLTSHILACDRTVHRYRVTDPSKVVPWVKVRRAYRWAEELESADGARPRHWWVSGVAVPVVYDPIRAVVR